MQNIAHSTSRVAEPGHFTLSFIELQALLRRTDTLSCAPIQTGGQADRGLYDAAIWLGPLSANDPNKGDPDEDDPDDDDDDFDEIDPDFPDELPDTNNPETTPSNPREMNF